MNDLLPILYGFGELAVMILLLSVLRSGKAKPEPEQEPEERPEEDTFDTNFDEDEPRPSRWNRQVH